MQKLLSRFDNLQRAKAILGFPYAVIKKYGDDQASYQAALITYYGFLSLFPLLLVATSITQIISKHSHKLQLKINAALSSRIPILGGQLHNSIHSSSKTGLALIVGLLLALYGAKGVADAFQNVMNNVWQIPKTRRSGFPKAPLKSLLIILIGGLGLIVSGAASGIITGSGKGIAFKIFSFLVSYLITVFTLDRIIKLALSQKVKSSDIKLATIGGAFGLQLMQLFGGYLLQHQLANASSLYGTFALVLGLLFWIYLQVEILLYAAEASTVWALKLWPRALIGNNLTTQDKAAYKLYADREKYQKNEYIKVRFRKVDIP